MKTKPITPRRYVIPNVIDDNEFRVLETYLRLHAHGRVTNALVAAELGVASSTVFNNLHRCWKKLGVSGRDEFIEKFRRSLEEDIETLPP